MKSPQSRRRFIKNAIASSVITASCSRLWSARARADAVEVPPQPIQIQINGRSRPCIVAPQETLAQTLRDKLDLTGTKIGCNRGECGACTVLIDDIPNYACSPLTHSVRGRRGTTIEGLQGDDGTLHRVQQAFIDELAPQCGFCTPGQIMSTVALLKENPNPTRDEARQALSGNICRCGAYDHYLNGVMRAAKKAG